MFNFPKYALGAAIFLLPSTAWSDNIEAVYQSLEISEAQIIPMTPSSTSRLSMKLSNESPSAQIFIGIKGARIAKSIINGQIGKNEYTPLGSITINPEEQLDFSSSHLVLELSGMSIPFGTDQDIGLELLTPNGSFPFVAHLQKPAKNNKNSRNNF